MAKVKEQKVGMDALLETLEKKYGVEKPSISDLQIVSTGSLQLNQAMGINGTALGKIVEIFGPESSGKSTIVLHQLAEYQKAFPEKKVAYFDYEHSFDKKYAAALGVDIVKLLVYQPETMESGYDMILALVKNNITSCIVVDSQSAAEPKAVLEGDMGDSTVGLQARINSKFCMKIKGLLDNHNCSLFLISQLRDAIGSMGESTTTTGGKAIKFYADVRWKVWKMNDKINELNKTTVDVIKNKLASPFGQAKFNIVWGKGIDKLGEILEYAVEFNIVKKSGSWYSYDETKLGQGAEGVKILLNDNLELLEEIQNKVINRLENTEEKNEELY
jgi:recombination protein RecA